MAEETKSSAPDSPQVAAVKFKKAELERKRAFLATQQTTPGFELDAAKQRNANQLAEIDAELKRLTK